MKTIEEMSREIDRLDVSLAAANDPSLTERQAEELARSVLAECQEVVPGSGMQFYVLDDPSDMPSDARVDFLYRPTYFAAATLISLSVRWPTLLDGERQAAFAAILRACTGRGLRGHGYEAEDGLIDAIEILLRAPVKRFFAESGQNHPEFAACFVGAIETLRDFCGGTKRPAFGSSDEFVRRAKNVFSRWENR